MPRTLTPEQRAARNAAKTLWDSKNTKQVKLNWNTDTDIIFHLDDLDNVQGYLKALIRADIAKNK